MTSNKASIMLRIEASPKVEEDQEYRRGYLLETELKSFGEAILRIRDRSTGETRSITVSHAASYLGSFKEQFSDKFYNQFGPNDKNPGNYSDLIMEKLLDTRESGLTFYYHYPQSTAVGSPKITN